MSDLLMPTTDSNEELAREIKRSHEHVAYLEGEIERADEFSVVKKLQHRLDIAKAYASGLQRAEHYFAIAIADREAAVREAHTWWITTGMKQNGKKLLGPFATRDLALSVRTYMEIAEAPATYWVEQLIQQKKG